MALKILKVWLGLYLFYCDSEEQDNCINTKECIYIYFCAVSIKQFIHGPRGRDSLNDRMTSTLMKHIHVERI